MKTLELARAIFVGAAVGLGLCIVFAFTSEPPRDCYKSTMGNPEEVVMIDGDPFACSNNLKGYRCQKMVPCH